MSIENQLNTYIHEHIPITQALGANIQFASREKVVVTAPIKNNVNHQHTVFGGSLHAVATLACWSLLYTHFMDSLGKIDIVLSHSTIDYLNPVTADFAAVCIKPEKENWDKFAHMLARKGKARIDIASQIFENNQLSVQFQGTFAVLVRT